MQPYMTGMQRAAEIQTISEPFIHSVQHLASPWLDQICASFTSLIIYTRGQNTLRKRGTVQSKHNLNPPLDPL